MSIHMGASPAAHGNQPSLPRVLSKEDRLRAFRRAHRHTWFVRLMKLLMPLASLVILGLFFIPAGRKSFIPDIPVTIADIDLSSDGLKMMRPSYVGGNEKLGRYRIEAAQAMQQISAMHVLDMSEINALVDHPDKKWTKLTASKGIYDTKQETLILDGQILVSSDRGLAAELTRAEIDIKQQVLTSPAPVALMLDRNRVNALGMKLFGKEKRVLFEGDVKTHIDRDPNADPQAGAEQQPIDIRAETLEVRDGEKTAVFTDRVDAVQGKYRLTANRLKVAYEGGLGTDAKSAAKPASASAGDAAGAIRSIEADGNVVLTGDNDQKATGDWVRYDAASKKLTLGDGVVMTQGVNRLSGGQLWIDLATRRSRLDSATAGADVYRRVVGRFQPSKAEPAKAASAKTPSPSAGTPQAAGGVGMSAQAMRGSNEPIHIEADSLDIFDDKQHAIFNGNVKAHQGQFKLASKQVRINYTGGIGTGDIGTAGTGKAQGKAAAAALKSIDATGKVAIVTPDGQTTTSDWAKFDLAANTVTIGGNMILSQGANVMRGDTLTIDLSTGQSRIDVTSSSDGTGKRPRISGVFIPGRMKEQNKAAGAPAAEKQPYAADAAAEQPPPLPVPKEGMGGGD